MTKCSPQPLFALLLGNGSAGVKVQSFHCMLDNHAPNILKSKSRARCSEQMLQSLSKRMQPLKHGVHSEVALYLQMTMENTIIGKEAYISFCFLPWHHSRPQHLATAGHLDEAIPSLACGQNSQCWSTLADYHHLCSFGASSPMLMPFSSNDKPTVSKQGLCNTVIKSLLILIPLHGTAV